MDDLVERLRSVDISWSETGEWCAEAADRIEALTADLRAAMNELNACKDALAQDGELLTIAYMDGSHRSTKAHRSRIEALIAAGDKLAVYAVHDWACEDMTGAYPGSCSCGYSAAMKDWKEARGE